MKRLAGLLILAAGCQSSAPYTLGAAVLNTAIAGGVAAGRRAGGECFTPCVKGTRCNLATGFCDPIPCRGECQEWQHCVESGLVPHCADGAAPALMIERKKGEKPPEPIKPFNPGPRPEPAPSEQKPRTAEPEAPDKGPGEYP